MPRSGRVLVAGESWISQAAHVKGFDAFGSATYETGVGPLRDALVASGFEVDYLPGHEVPERFPEEPDALAPYGAVVLSDIGASSLLLHPRTWVHGLPSPNRLKLLRAYVEGGGGLLMVGGYLSFQGYHGTAGYRGTPVETILPVTLEVFDDREEVPEGFVPEVVSPHAILRDLPPAPPPLLGLNRTTMAPGGQLLLRGAGYPLLAVREVVAGRTAAWTSDIGPHWCPGAFVAWPGYRRLFAQLIAWLVEGTA